MIKNIIRIESFLLFLSAVYFYYALGGNWALFIILLFTPDISMLGYLKDRRLGALTYNLIHNYVIAIILVSIGLIVGNVQLQYTGLILIAHVGLDRSLGFGLKYKSGFNHTHIQKL